jgi:hypothetical protein
MLLAALAVTGLGVLAEPALATFHMNMVNEVMLASGTGDSSVRYVEFVDQGGTEEQFTPAFAPYKLVVYDAAGTKLAEQTLNPNGLRAAAAVGREYLVSTPAADAMFSVAGDERLTVSLPRAAGQACFEGNQPSGPHAVSCLTWGAISKPVAISSFGTGSANGPVPPNGESDQRQPSNSILAACPTPKAPNRSKSCTTVPPEFAGVSVAARNVHVTHAGQALVRLRCPAGTNGSCHGRLVLTSASGRSTFGSARFNIPAATTATVKVRLSKPALRLLKHHSSLTARGRVNARDGAGTQKITSARLTLVGS